MTLLRMVFPGGNTCTGFHSFYQYIVPSDATRSLILKGGPGVGKSTFMKKLGADLGAAGYNRELHWCSSDNDSLDALVLPDYQIAVMDGTAPHVVDPLYPGAVDEIVNLGEFWNESRLIKSKGRIIDITQLISMYFRIAYLRLKEAYAIWNELTEYFSNSVSENARRNILRTLKLELGSSGILSTHNKTRDRHLFASAITPAGVVNHASSLFEEDYKVLALGGSPGTGLHSILASLLQWTMEEMIPVEVYHNCFMPSFLEMLIFRAAKTVILDASGMVVNYEPVLGKVSHGRLFDLDQEVDAGRIFRFGGEIEDSRERFHTAINGAVGFISLAKQAHDELEQLYVPAMDFNRLDQKYVEIKQRILKYIALSPAQG